MADPVCCATEINLHKITKSTITFATFGESKNRSIEKN